MSDIKCIFKPRLLRAIGIFIILMAPQLINAEAALFQLPMRDLLSGSRHSIVSLSDKPKVIVIAEPDCKWCKKQLHDMAVFHRQCQQQFDTVIIGVMADRRELKSMLLRIPGEYYALQGSSQFMRSIGKSIATPLTLFVTASGELAGQQRGYLSQKTMLNALRVHTGNPCAS